MAFFCQIKILFDKGVILPAALLRMIALQRFPHSYYLFLYAPIPIKRVVQSVYDRWPVIDHYRCNPHILKRFLQRPGLQARSVIMGAVKCYYSGFQSPTSINP